MWAGGCIRFSVLAQKPFFMNSRPWWTVLADEFLPAGTIITWFSAQKPRFLEFSSMNSAEFRIVSDLLPKILLFEGRGCVKIMLLCRIHCHPGLQIKRRTLFWPACVDVIFSKLSFCTEISLDGVSGVSGRRKWPWRISPAANSGGRNRPEWGAAIANNATILLILTMPGHSKPARIQDIPSWYGWSPHLYWGNNAPKKPRTQCCLRHWSWCNWAWASNRGSPPRQ